MGGKNVGEYFKGVVETGSNATQYLNGEISGLEATFDIGMGIIGMIPLPGCAAVSLLYSVSKAAYEYSSGNTLFDKPAKQTVSPTQLKM
ncbi:hypothetical protein CHU92_12510 [Flavobacterium cyanobacteriorum]|uniref:Uncharacterized protein n=1 Tax=Flavobacterium cyanobacteriorum TaxID=2022802 RepID=A0A255YZ03_9FLAO|nr:hypothetical protein [Flavobacterium cyanobacteriorum]OYQ33904.1 hypothetical protein CHU92_12510 [Flavobacterium cyanobacteriorum]